MSLKRGDVLLPRVGSSYYSTFTEIKLVASHFFKGTLYWWAEARTKADISTMESFSVSTLGGYFDPKPSFYSVGKKYQFKDRARDDVWLILDTYLIENSQYGEKAKAVAKMTTGTGYQDIQTLDASDFARMEQI